jgi:hypothetical protein
MLIFFFLIVLNCEGREAKTVEDIIRETLAMNNLEEGYNLDRNAVVAIEKYRFGKHVKRLTQEKIFEAYDVAYLRAIGEIADFIGTREISSVSERKDGEVDDEQREIKQKVSHSLYGPLIFTHASSWTQEEGFEVAIAVVWSKKRQDLVNSILKDKVEEMSVFFRKVKSLDEFWRNYSYEKNMHFGMLCDDDSRRYIYGISAYDADEKDGLQKARARAAYALENVLGGNVKTEALLVESKGAENKRQEDVYKYVRGGHALKEETSYGVRSFKSCVCLEPLLAINPLSYEIYWHEKSAIDSFTGKKIKVVMALIDVKKLENFLRGYARELK